MSECVWYGVYIWSAFVVFMCLCEFCFCINIYVPTHTHTHTHTHSAHPPGVAL